jgi:methionyl-tRNA formyltransferase
VRIVFWGTPDFALPALDALLGEGHDVVGVVTQPDRPAGRGRAARASPVKLRALEERLPVLQPERARGAEFLDALRKLEPELSVVVAYGQILRPEVLELPRRGSLNVHASLLPELRGAAPINWALIRGHTETGVTIMRMTAGMDEGPILLQVREPIEPDERAGDLWLRLAQLGAEALVEALMLLELGELPEREQDHDRATYAPRLTREDARLDWSAPAGELANRIRGLDHVPGAWTLHRGAELKVYRPQVAAAAERAADSQAQAPAEAGGGAGGAVPRPGTVLRAEPNDPALGVLVACGAGALWVREVKPAGRRRMTAAEWVRGRGAVPGEVLGA